MTYALSILAFGATTYAALSLFEATNTPKNEKQSIHRSPASTEKVSPASSHNDQLDQHEQTLLTQQNEKQNLGEPDSNPKEGRDADRKDEKSNPFDDVYMHEEDESQSEDYQHIGSHSYSKNPRPEPKAREGDAQEHDRKISSDGSHTLTNSNLDSDSNTGEASNSSDSSSTETTASRATSSNTQKYIYGTVPALEGKITPTTSSIIDTMINRAHAASCSAEVGLHKLKNDGTIEQEPVASAVVDENARYNFSKIEELELPDQFQFDYLLRLQSQGCSLTKDLNRYVTGYNLDQTINSAANFISYTRFLTSYSSDKNNWEVSKVSKLTNDLEGHNTTSETYHNGMLADSELTQRFETIFNIVHSDMETLPPQVLYTSIIDSLEEKNSYTHTAKSQHWDDNYDLLTEWVWDGRPPVFGKDFNQDVGANEQGTRVLILRIGEDDGLGRVDTGQDYREFSYNISVDDTHPVTSPDFELVTDFPGYFNDINLNLDINTGSLFINCETLSSLAITESSIAPAESEFTIDCTSDPSQITPYTLTDTQEGEHQLYLWAIDSSSNISSPTSLSFELITTPPNTPVGTLSSPSIAGVTDVTFDITSCQPQTWLAFTMNDTQAPAPTDASWLGCSEISYQELQLPTVESSHTARVWSRDAAGNISTSALSESIIYDITAPTINFSTDLTSTLRGGTSLALNFSTSDLNGVQQFQLYYAQDGVNYGLVEDLNVSSTGTTWAIPTDDTLNAKLKLVSSDQSSPSNTSEFESIDFEIDSTAPGAPTVTLNSPDITSSLPYSVTVSDCTDRPQVIVTNSSTAPDLSDPNWQTCSTAAGAITGQLPGGSLDGSKTIYVYAQDSVGNISSSSSLSLIYDTTAPDLNLTTAPSAPLKGGENFLVEFNSSDTNGLSDFRLEYAVDGTNFSTVQTLAETDTSYSWSIPTDDTTVAKIRLVSVDNATTANQTIVESSAFTIDSTPPAVPSVTLNSPNITSSLSHSVTLTDCSDSSEAIVTNSSTTPSLTDSRWQTCSTAAGAVTGSLPDPSSDGVKNIYVFKKDSVGNISNSSSLSLTYDTTAPDLSSTTLLSGAYKGGNAITLDYSTSDTNSVSDVFFMYASDGVTFDEAQKVPLDPNLSSYTWNWPTDDTTNAKIKIVSRDTASGYNESSLELGPFEIDSTPPTLPSPSLNSPNISSSLAVAVTLANCSDSSDAIITNSNTTPSLSDPDWQTCSTAAGAITGLLPNPSADGSKTIYIFKKDSVGNISNSSSLSLIYDTTAPSLNLTTAPSAPLKGGENFLVEFDSSDINGLSDFRLEYAADGTNFATVQTFAEADTGHNWSIPTDDTTAAKIRLVSVDNAISANQTIVESSAFTIDSTPPAVPSVTLNSPSITSSLSHSVTLADCSDSSDAIVTNSSTTPSLSDSRWQTCSTAAGAITGSLPDPSLDGAKTIYVFKKDSVGNISNSSSLSLTYDKSPPLLTLTTAPSAPLRGADTFLVEFESSDENGLSDFKLEYAADGTTFTTVQTFAETDTSYNWSVPSDNTAQAKIRLVSRDNAVSANESIVESAAFTIDSNPPAAPSLTIESADPTSLSSINLTAASCTDRPEVFISESATAPSRTDANWITCNETASGLSYSFSTPISEGSITLYFYAKDSVENISSSSTGSIVYDVTSPTLSSTTSLTGTYRGGDSVTLNYDTSDTNGVNEVFFMYAADGTTFDEAQKISLDESLNSFSWNWPTDDTTTAKIKFVSRDIATSYNESTLELGPFEIDSTPSPVPSVSFHNPSNTPAITGQSSVELTTASCNDIDQIFVSKSATAPSSTDAGWQTCSTALGAITYSFIAPIPETTHQLYIYSQDDHGNISTATTLDVIYDITSPALSLSTTFDSIYRGGETLPLSFSNSDANGLSSFELQFAADGTNFTTVTSFNETDTSYSWSVPSLNTTGAKLRLVSLDNSQPKNSSTVESTSFEIDSTAPVLTIDSPAELSFHRSSVTVSGSCETGLDVAYSGDILTDFSGSCTSGSYSQSLSFTSGDGNKTITLTQTDAAGNVTSVSRTFIRDEEPPIITRTSGDNPAQTNTNSYTWGGSCEGNYTINVTGDQTDSFNCNSGSWTWTNNSITTDGTYNFTLNQTDAAGNVSSDLSLTWTRDATPPAFNASTPTAINAGETQSLTSNADSLNFSGNCEGTNSITISGAESAVISCSSSSWNWTTPTYSTDATRSYTFSQSDPSGNTSTLQLNWTRDTTGPALYLATESTTKTNLNTQTFTGTCDSSYSVDISGAETASVACNSGSWTWTTSTVATDANRSYTFSQTNGLGTTTSVSANWIRATSLPTISALSTSASSPTKTSFIPIALEASSQNTNVNISHFCLKVDDTTAPTENDDCWKYVSSPSVGLPLSETLSLTDFSFLLGWTPQTYAVHSWVMDEAKNISSYTATSGTDTFSITYSPGIPPEVMDVIAANSDTTLNPPTQSESQVPAGSDVYIRWKATNPEGAFPSGAISIYYTENERDFTEISGAQALDNANYGCPNVVLGTDEGCFKWTGGSPLNTSYKIRVRATNASDLSAQSISSLLNSGKIKILAGNTESGLGGSATTALFFTRKNGSESDPGSLTVTPDGRFYFADHVRGILTVDPNDGKQKVFIPTTGTSTGDGGPATDATLNHPVKTALDFQGRLLILDVNRIRRVDLNQSTPTIETIIGGGTNTADSVANPLDLQIYNHSKNSWTSRGQLFFAAPNGDIYFHSDYGIKNPSNPDWRVRVYKASTNSIQSIYMGGIGDGRDSAQDLSKCRLQNPGFRYNSNSEITGATAVSRYNESWTGCDTNNSYNRFYMDPANFTSSAGTQLDNSYRYYRYFHTTGMNGQTYVTIDRNYVNRVNFDGTYTRILGSGTRGQCPDGTLPTSCNMDIQDIFVTPDEKIYFVDGGLIRTIDENGEVKTLFGQRPSYGDGVNALNARFEHVNFVMQRDNGDIIVNDSHNFFFKEFTVEGNINIIAGDGTRAYQNETDLAQNQSVFYTSWAVGDPASGDLYTRRHYGGEITRLNRSTSKWEKVIGGGATHYSAGDGLAGLDIQSGNSQHHGLPLGFDGQNLLYTRMRYNSTDQRYDDFMLKLYDSSDSFRQSHIIGHATGNSNYDSVCPDGSTASSCKWIYHGRVRQPHWDSTNNRWILPHRNTRYIYGVTQGGNFNILARAARRMDSGSVLKTEGSSQMLYYCYGGRFYKHDITTDTDLGALEWPISNMYCRGLKMDYNSTRNSLIFPFEQNGLYGVGEYFLP